MYSNIKSVQLLISMLKKKNIRDVVISPGNSHNAIVRSIENDNDFKTYNIVDERSAAFFAIGIIQELERPVAIICTAGTAASNYLSGISEAFRRELPLVVVTADKNPYYLNQHEDQMINQINIFDSVTKGSITLPIIKDYKDEWYCNRILNEIFLEMKHHGQGPIHINIPIEDGMLAIGNTFNSKELIDAKIIERIDHTSSQIKIQKKFNALKGKKILFLMGQANNVPLEQIEIMESIFKKYNCVFAIDKLSNIACKGTIETIKVCRSIGESVDKIIPDIVITMAGNSVSDLKFILKNYSRRFESWIVTESGKVADRYKNLSCIFETSTLDFLKMMNKYGDISDYTYYNIWNDEVKKFRVPEFEYSNLYTVKKLMENIPKESILNLANSTTIRIAQYFNLDEKIQVYCNRGVNGIDGCMSTFIGQSCVTDKLSFLIIGDLTFFYDMNALWNRYSNKNIRIMLNNNGGAALFHFNQGLKEIPTLNENIAAEHFTNAKGWVESLGYKYLSASNKIEFDKAIVEFISNESDKPILFEVFTDKEFDAKSQHEFFDFNTPQIIKIKKDIKNSIKKIVRR